MAFVERKSYDVYYITRTEYMKIKHKKYLFNNTGNLQKILECKTKFLTVIC